MFFEINVTPSYALKVFLPHLRILFLFLHLCCFVQRGEGQVYPTFKKYTAENGLPSSHVYEVIEDQKGFIWIATDRGLTKYDGYSFKYFTAKDGLPSDDVFKLSEDNQGRIWLSTFNEIGYIFNDQYHSITTPDGVSTSGVLIHYIFRAEECEGHFVEISKNKLWLKIDDEIITVLDKFDPIFDTELGWRDTRNLFYLGMDEDEKNWFAHLSHDYNTFLLSYLNEQDMFTYVKESCFDVNNHPNQFKGHFLPNGEKSLVVTGNQMYIFDYQKFEKIEFANDFKFINPISSFLINSNTLLLKEKNRKNYLFDHQESVLREVNMFSNEDFKSVLEDRKGNLWATSFTGLSFQSGSYRELQTVSFEKESNYSAVTAIFKDNKGRIWFGTKDQRLFYKNNKNLFVEIEISIKEQGTPKEIFSISNNPISGIIIGGNFGVLNITEQEINRRYVERRRYSDAKFNFSATDSLNINELIIKNIFAKENNVYLGSSRGFFSFSDTSSFTIAPNGKIQMNDRVYAITSNENNDVYLGKKSGLYKMTKGEETFLDFASPISTLICDSKNNIWIGTEGNGLAILMNDEIYTFPETAEKTIKAIRETGENEVWILTDTDILKVDLSKKKTNDFTLRYSSLAEGLQIKTINNLLVDNDTVYLCSNYGLQTLSKKLFNWKIRNREIFFTELKINGKSVELKDNYELKHNENCLEINYVSLEFNKPDEVNYEYKMEGLDTTWHSSNSLKQEFWFLQPGTYVFHLRAGLNRQNISKTKKLIFHIRTPWWKTPMTWMFLSLMFILIVIGITYERSKRIIRKAKEKARIEEQISDMRLQALQSQMNPHFIFNSLQAIQDYIFDKNEEQANRYLVKFSRLMRLILESSRKKFILLSEELKLIELYVSLEQLRFSEQFSYQLSLSKNINKDILLVPSMLIQPFIENAVNHGLFHKKNGHGLLELSIEKVDNCLHIIVADNGIGLKAAQEIKEKMDRKEASRALEIVRERTGLYNKTMEEDIDLKIENRYDAEGKVAGTIVTLKLILPETQNSRI